MRAVAIEHQGLCGQKRRRDAVEEEHGKITAASVQPLGKSVKRRRQPRRETNTAYWDSLSKLWLTRRALGELDRRNRHRFNFVRPVITRSSDLDDGPGQLTNLKRFARHGGPDLRDLRGWCLGQELSKSLLIPYPQYLEPSTPNSTDRVMPSDRTSSRRSKPRKILDDSTGKTTTTKTKKTSPYDPNFEQNLVDNSIYPDDHDFADGRDPPRPDNENEILDRLKRPRSSLSPSRFSANGFRAFKQTNSRALNEDAMMADVFPLIQGTTRIPSAKNLVFANLEPLPQGNLVYAKPDSYDGARPTGIDIQIRKHLGSYITPATQGQAPALPNFFTEVKGPDGSAAVAKRQACFDGALGARGIYKVQSFEADPTFAYDNKAYTITSTYHDGTLKMYTVHPTQTTEPKDTPEYHMSQLGAWALTGSIQQFREGTGAFRNARDWANTQRDEVIAAANTRVTGQLGETSTLEPSNHSISQSTVEPNGPASKTSADELSQYVDPGPSLSYKRLKREPA